MGLLGREQAVGKGSELAPTAFRISRERQLGSVFALVDESAKPEWQIHFGGSSGDPPLPNDQLPQAFPAAITPYSPGERFRNLCKQRRQFRNTRVLALHFAKHCRMTKA